MTCGSVVPMSKRCLVRRPAEPASACARSLRRPRPVTGYALGPVRPCSIARRRNVEVVYDHDFSEVEQLGWEEFIARQWESIFVGYRSWTGLRTMGRRWSDLIEVGLGCSPGMANQLVRSGLIYGQDRGFQERTDAQAVVSGMIGVLADLRSDLAGMAEQEPEASIRLLEQHARLLRFIRDAFGQDGAAPGP
jgi:hypothetical protein